MPCIDSYKKVDLRTVSFDVPPQEVLSRDRSVGLSLRLETSEARNVKYYFSKSVTVTVDAVIYYRVFNPIMVSLTASKCPLY